MGLSENGSFRIALFIYIRDSAAEGTVVSEKRRS